LTLVVAAAAAAVPLERFVTTHKHTNTRAAQQGEPRAAAAGRIFTSGIYSRGLNSQQNSSSARKQRPAGDRDSDLNPRFAVLLPLAFGPALREGGETETETNNRTNEGKRNTHGKGKLCTTKRLDTKKQARGMLCLCIFRGCQGSDEFRRGEGGRQVVRSFSAGSNYVPWTPPRSVIKRHSSRVK